MPKRLPITRTTPTVAAETKYPGALHRKPSVHTASNGRRFSSATALATSAVFTAKYASADAARGATS